MRSTLRHLIAVSCTSAAIVSSTLVVAADPERQAEVSARGQDVMPFSLSATTHVFAKTASGAFSRWW